MPERVGLWYPAPKVDALEADLVAIPGYPNLPPYAFVLAYCNDSGEHVAHAGVVWAGQCVPDVPGLRFLRPFPAFEPFQMDIAEP